MDVSALRGHPLFEEIPTAALEVLGQRCAVRKLAPNDVLLRPGESNHTLYFLLAGRLEVHLDALESGNSFPVLPGEVIGEMSLIEHRRVSAWARASEPSTLLAMPEEVFWEDFLPLPGAGPKLLGLLIDRMRQRDRVVLTDFEHKMRYEHLERELESAGKIQANILPALPLFPHRPQVEAHAFIKPARQVGGDFFDAFPLDAHRVFVAVGDVSGKGMAAALFMVRVMTLLRLCVMAEHREGILSALNRGLCEGNADCMFVTLAAAMLDTATGRLTYLNGGHNPPLLSVRGGPFQLWQPPRGTLLGVQPEAVFEARELQLQPGDTLVLFTDGVSEAENFAQEQFQQGRAAAALNQVGPGAAVQELVGKLASAVAEFAGEASQSDDIAIVGVRYRGKEA